MLILGHDHSSGYSNTYEEDTGGEENIQDLIAEYIVYKCKENGSLTTDDFNWHWSMEYTEEPKTPDEKNMTARLVHEIEPGHEYILYSESQGAVVTVGGADDDFTVTETQASGNTLI